MDHAYGLLVGPYWDPPLLARIYWLSKNLSSLPETKRIRVKSKCKGKIGLGKDTDVIISNIACSEGTLVCARGPA